MKKVYWIIAIVVVIGIAFAAVNANKGEQAIEVTVGKADRGDITSVVTATGTIFPEVEVRISSEVAGEIVELPVKDGQTVKKGDLLVRVNPDTLEAQVSQQEAALRANEANAAEAKARMLQAELNVKRIRSLHEKGYATPDQVEESETQYDISQASYQAALSRIDQQQMSLQEAKESLAKAATYSPIDGTITALKSELGDRVVGTGQFEGTEIMRVANLNNMEARVEVSEADIVSVKIGDEATIEVEALPDRILKGSVSEIANSAQEDESNGGSSQELITFLVKVRILDESATIRPGMTATADIKTKTVSNVVKVPLQAVTVRARDAVVEQIGEPSDASRSEEVPSSGDDAEKGQAARGDESNRGGGGRSGGPGGGEGGPSRRASNLERVVFLYQDGKAIMRRVTTGLADNRSIEIVSGVEEGDEIITGGYRVLTRELTHEMPVSIAEPAKPAAR